jgi:low temperature requirement protein LtrA
MFRKIDQSPSLITALQKLSSVIARYRGLPILIGIVLVAISLVLSVLNLSAGSAIISLLQTLAHHIGIILALVGILMAQPLGN